MGSPSSNPAVTELLIDEAPKGVVKKKFGNSKASPDNAPKEPKAHRAAKAPKETKAAPRKKAAPQEEVDPDKKYPFTSTITGENKRRFANFQANKPGRHDTGTTDVLNAALKMFFDDKRNRKYADPEASGGNE